MTSEVPLREVPNVMDLWDRDNLKGGEFNWNLGKHGEKIGMVLCCPGCKSVHAIPFVGDGPKRQWNGNPDKPTLHPSLNHPGCWHGWLKAGVLVPC